MNYEKVKRYLIFLLIGVLSLPFGAMVMFFSSGTASAAEKNKPKVVKTENQPLIKGVLGLSKDRTYYPGERINLTLILVKKNLRAWANISSLDNSFSKSANFIQADEITWKLATPILSDNLFVGEQTISIFVEDEEGNTSSQILSVILKKLPQLEITSIIASPKHFIDIKWNPIASAKGYLVEWNEQGSTVTSKRKIGASYTTTRIEDLKPGGVYNFRIWPITLSGIKGKASEAVAAIPVLKASAVAEKTSQKVAPQVTPAIGGGVSTAKPQVKSATLEKPKITPSIVPSVSPSPAPKEETKGGWNRLLVALAILIIAAGASIGGYYGYEWWQGRSKKDEPSSGSSNRW